MGYCERRIALWQKYKTDLAIRMLPSEVRGRSGSHSGSYMSSAMNRVLDVAMKPRSRAHSQSRSRAESSVIVDDKDNNREIKIGATPRNIEIAPRDPSATFNPYNSSKDALKLSQRKVGGGAGGGAVIKSALGTITSGNKRHYLSLSLLSHGRILLTGLTRHPLMTSLSPHPLTYLYHTTLHTTS